MGRKTPGRIEIDVPDVITPFTTPSSSIQKAWICMKLKGRLVVDHGGLDGPLCRPCCANTNKGAPIKSYMFH